MADAEGISQKYRRLHQSGFEGIIIRARDQQANTELLLLLKHEAIKTSTRPGIDHRNTCARVHYVRYLALHRGTALLRGGLKNTYEADVLFYGHP